MAELKQCPFCGSKRLNIFEGLYTYLAKEGAEVICETCGASCGVYYTKQQAIDACNKRIVK